MAAAERYPSLAIAQWNILWADGRPGKGMFEFTCTIQGKTRRLIGKQGKLENLARDANALSTLWQAGFRPPQQFTVPEVILFWPEKRLLIEERADGRELLDILLETNREVAAAALTQAAEWFAAVHRAYVTAPQVDVAARTAKLNRYVRDLRGVFSGEHAKLREICTAGSAALEKGTTARPCHGDAHPKNVFVAESRTTGIDLDKFVADSPESDIGYFVGQLAAIGRVKFGSFGATGAMRRHFVGESMRVCAGQLDRRMIGAAAALTVLRTLHYNVCGYKTAHGDETWISESAAMLDGT